MKNKYEFEWLLVTEKYNSPDQKFHDDYYSDGDITVKEDFPFKHIFGDFRIFNGMRLEDMDDFLIKLANLLTEIQVFPT